MVGEHPHRIVAQRPYLQDDSFQRPPMANDASPQSAPWEYSDTACSTFLSHLSFESGLSPPAVRFTFGTDLRDASPTGDPTVTAFLINPVTIYYSKDNYESWENSQTDASIKDNLSKKPFEILYVLILGLALTVIGLFFFIHHKKE